MRPRLFPVHTISSDFGLDPATVVVARTPTASYGPETIEYFRGLLQAAQLERVVQGKRVLLKPNWVMHENQSGQGLDCLITHPKLIEVIAEATLRAGAAQLVIADAPVQGCDFSRLAEACSLSAMRTRLERLGEVHIRDLRLITRTGGELWSRVTASERTIDDYVRFDLGEGSRLEPVTGGSGNFRVTCYDPAELQKTHAPGRHCYLIARELIESDVVLNVPKLKTHGKAGMTAALKNLVGVNGHKSYLPHHRRGATGDGGDCYEQRRTLKRAAEFALDQCNAAGALPSRYLWGRVAGLALSMERYAGGDADVEGSWYGNDTVWRMVLDLHAIARYGTAKGVLAATPRRRILNITDAVIAGEADGPLRPEPAALGYISLSYDCPAADWVNALLLGMDPRCVPAIIQCFTPSVPPQAAFSPDKISVRYEGIRMNWTEAGELFARDLRAPAGWRGRCEWRLSKEAAC
ncbi:MAG: DUF362 domain-containing protein [Deltaproteobacteria bacterium]|nr:DUF362 domain-containing protein [Deltaproteobacteria bacterium]